jgi:ABC-2 type transport system ATP-binding protein
LKIWDVIEEFNASGGSTLLTTHYMEEAARLCDRISIIDRGRLIALGTEDELVRSLDADQIVEFSVKGQLEDGLLEGLPGVRRVVAKNNVYTLTVSDVGAALRALLTEVERKGLELIALTTHQATLEDVFVSLTGKMLRDD